MISGVLGKSSFLRAPARCSSGLKISIYPHATGRTLVKRMTGTPAFHLGPPAAPRHSPAPSRELWPLLLMHWRKLSMWTQVPALDIPVEPSLPGKTRVSLAARERNLVVSAQTAAQCTNARRVSHTLQCLFGSHLQNPSLKTECTYIKFQDGTSRAFNQPQGSVWELGPARTHRSHTHEAGPAL